MTLDEIKTAVDEGKIVCWKNPMYQVRKYGKVAPQSCVHYYVVCTANGDCTGLTWQDGVTMEYAEKDFFILKSEVHYPEVIIYHREPSW